MASARLVFESESHPPVDLLPEGETTVGRALSNHVVVDDPTVSRKHAVLRPDEDGGILLLDLGSANGTFVNDRRLVVPTRLKHRDLLRFGSVPMRFLDESMTPADTPDSEEEAEDSSTQVVSSAGDEPVLVGIGPAMQEVFDLMDKASASPIAVLVEGETGTGKELVARGIHELSPRAKRPFVAINCAAVPESLIESELFGHRRGTFTGAERDREGLFEAASGGTIFLDEIGEIPLSVQAKLLRVLQEREVKRLGDTQSRKVDVRVISATNRDLRAESERGAFRSDLFYRLAAFPIHLPPLRQRREDIPLLVKRFVAVAAQHHGKAVHGADLAALECLVRYPWPGNVRELQNEIQRAVAIARDGETIGVAHLSATVRDGGARPSAGGLDDLEPDTLQLPTDLLGAATGETGSSPEVDPEATPSAPTSGALRDVLATMESRYISQILAREGGNVARTARVLGLTRAGLYKKMKAYGIR